MLDATKPATKSLSQQIAYFALATWGADAHDRISDAMFEASDNLDAFVGGLNEETRYNVLARASDLVITSTSRWPS